MGGELSRAGVLGHADRHRRAPFVAEHRLPRGRAPGDHGRSGLARRALPRSRRAPGQGPRRRAHGRPYHLSVGRGAAAKFGRKMQDRASPPSPSTPISRSRIICAIRARPSSTGSTPIPISMSPAPAIISIWRRISAARSPAPSEARGPASAWFPSPRTGFTPPPKSRAIVHALNAGGARCRFVEIETDKGHDAFLLEEPDFLATTRGFLRGGAKARGLAETGGGNP